MTLERIEEIKKAISILNSITRKELEDLKAEWIGLQEKSQLSSIPLEEKKVILLLKKLGVPKHILGYKYLKEAILIAKENPQYMEGITKVIYTEVAKKFKTTPSRVARSIRYAIETTCQRGNYKKATEVFGDISYKNGKIKDSEVIPTIVEYLKLN